MSIASDVKGRLALVAMAVLALVLIACSSSSDSTDKAPTVQLSTAVSSSSNANLQVCTQLDKLNASVDGLKKLDSSSSVDDAKAAAKDVADSLKSLISAVGNSASSSLALVQSAINALASSLGSTSGSQAIGDRVSVLNAQVNAISDATTSVKTKAGC